MIAEIIDLEATQKVSEAESLAVQFDNYQIVTAEVYSQAGGDLKAVKIKYKELDELRKTMTKPLDESKKRIMEFFAKPLDYLKKAETVINSAMVNWQREQEKIRQAELARLQAIQQKEAERLAKLASNAEKRGDEDKAKEFQGRAAVVQTITPVVAQKVEKIAGLTTVINWKFRIVDVNKIPREYMLPNEVAIGQVARATKGTVKIEGVEFYSEESMRGTR